MYNDPETVVLNTLCAPSERIYAKEWKRLVDNPAYRSPMKTFGLDDVNAFSIATLYTTMKQDAPYLFRMLERLVGRSISRAVVETDGAL